MSIDFAAPSSIVARTVVPSGGGSISPIGEWYRIEFVLVRLSNMQLKDGKLDAGAPKN